LLRRACAFLAAAIVLLSIEIPLGFFALVLVRVLRHHRRQMRRMLLDMGGRGTETPPRAPL
jgi:hypothetical protein